MFFAALVAIWAALGPRRNLVAQFCCLRRAALSDYLASAARDWQPPQRIESSPCGVCSSDISSVSAIGLPLGLLTASLKFAEDTVGVLALGLQTFAERLLGPAGVAVVRTNRSRNALRRDHGDGLVSRDRDRYRGPNNSTDLCARGADEP